MEQAKFEKLIAEIEAESDLNVIVDKMGDVASYWGICSGAHDGPEGAEGRYAIDGMDGEQQQRYIKALDAARERLRGTV